MRITTFALSLGLLLYALAIFHITSVLWSNKGVDVPPIFLGFISGIISFYFAKLIGDPIVQWNQLRADIAATIIFYQNILLSENLNAEIRSKGQEELRRLAAKVLGLSQIIRIRFVAEAIFNIPTSTQFDSAVRDLIGLSNTIVDQNKNDRIAPFTRMGIYKRIISLEKILKIKIDKDAPEALKYESRQVELQKLEGM